MTENERIAARLNLLATEAHDRVRNPRPWDWAAANRYHGTLVEAAALLRSEPVEQEPRITEEWLRQRFPWISLAAILGKDEMDAVYREVVDALCSADLPVGEVVAGREEANRALAGITDDVVADLVAAAIGVGAGCGCSECAELRISLNLAAEALDAVRAILGTNGGEQHEK